MGASFLKEVYMSRKTTPPYTKGPIGIASRVADLKARASGFGSQTRGKPGPLANTVKEIVVRQREKAATKLHKAASVIDSVGPRASKAAHRVAQGLNATASYVEDHDLSDIGADVMSVFRRHPAQAFFSTLAIGFLLGRTMRR
jgi:hypothetical protein